MSEDRFSRIEDKLDKITDILTRLATHDERLTNLAERVQKTEERLNDLESQVQKNSTVNSIMRWLATTSIGALIIIGLRLLFESNGARNE